MKGPRLDRRPISSKREIRWLMQCILEYAEADSATQLAELTADDAKHGEWLDDETHWIWDLALEEWEARHGPIL